MIEVLYISGKLLLTNILGGLFTNSQMCDNECQGIWNPLCYHEGHAVYLDYNPLGEVSLQKPTTISFRRDAKLLYSASHQNNNCYVGQRTEWEWSNILMQ